MENLLVSACLLSFDCKYNGGNNALPPEALEKLRQHYRLIPVCPETAGGLPVPREPSERRGERVINRAGQDVTAEFQKGAEIAAALARRFKIRKALLKSNSPSCGSGSVYDGSFSGILTVGDGLACEYIKSEGIKVTSDYSELIQVSFI